MDDELVQRAEKARQETVRLMQRFLALRELRMLQNDFRSVAQNLASAVKTMAMPATQDGLRNLLADAEEWLNSAPPPD